MFYNRLSYGTCMLEKIINRHEESGAKIYVMYDIGCTLSAHLKVIRTYEYHLDFVGSVPGSF